MNETLWKMHLPVTGLIRGPNFKVLGGRTCQITFSIEDEGGGEKWETLRFEGVEGFKCTYLTSLGSIDEALRKQSYGTLISISESSWYSALKISYDDYYTSRRQTPKELRHVMITFDDGPCYELVCETFRAT